MSKYLFVLPLILFSQSCKENEALQAEGDSGVLSVASYSPCPTTVQRRATNFTRVADMLQPQAPRGQKVPSQAFNSKTFSRPISVQFPMGHQYFTSPSPITSYPHEGFDYSGTDALVSRGITVGRSNIHAVTDGKVAFVLKSCETHVVTTRQDKNLCGDGWGNQVVIDHGGNVYTRYAHLSTVSVNVNDVVRPGTVLGKGGTTGWSDGEHLHIEIGTLSAGRRIDNCKPTFFNMVYDPNPYLMGAVNGKEPLSAAGPSQTSAPAPAGNAQERAAAVNKKCLLAPVPDGTHANARNRPNGETIVGEVAKGTRVNIRGWVNDEQGRPWASIDGVDRRNNRPIGGGGAFVIHTQINLRNCQ